MIAVRCGLPIWSVAFAGVSKEAAATTTPMTGSMGFSYALRYLSVVGNPPQVYMGLLQRCTGPICRGTSWHRSVMWYNPVSLN